MALRPNAQPTERYWLVWCEDRGTPTTRHKTVDAAIQEAERLAAKHQGYKFDVLEVVGFAQKVVPRTFTYITD